MKANDIAELLERLSPVRFACDWDNVGMHVGSYDNEIHKIIVTVDADDAAVERAVAARADMIVAHHPLIFKGIKQINDKDFVGRRILKMIEHGINCYCMHTNFDSVGGMADAAADKISLKDAIVLEEILEGEGIGRVGNLDGKISVRELCDRVKTAFNLDKTVLYGDEGAVVSRVAICPGSGKDDIGLAIQKGADVIITGDITYHYGIDAVARGINVIDAGHYGIEHIFIEIVTDYLRSSTDGIEIIGMEINNPQKYI